jgi:hypothetical protein
MLGRENHRMAPQVATLDCQALLGPFSQSLQGSQYTPFAGGPMIWKPYVRTPPWGRSLRVPTPTSSCYGVTSTLPRPGVVVGQAAY